MNVEQLFAVVFSGQPIQIELSSELFYNTKLVEIDVRQKKMVVEWKQEDKNSNLNRLNKEISFKDFLKWNKGLVNLSKNKFKRGWKNCKFYTAQFLIVCQSKNNTLLL